MGIVEQYLLQLKMEKRRSRRAAAVLTVLSLLVTAGVSWNLRLTGITLANDACCGIEEHVHTDDCFRENSVCSYEEHLHIPACYSDPKADVEDALVWQEMFADYPHTGNLSKDLTGIAKTQVGYAESTRNFQVDDQGVQRGYTRYGAWYGAPYSDWSAMFVSFCLAYAGADLKTYPVNSGADTMAGLWEEQGKYVPAGQYAPGVGDLVFFKDNRVGIVAEVQDSTIYVVAGDVEGAVCGNLLSWKDASIAGWGMTGEQALQTQKYNFANTQTIDLLTYLGANEGSYIFTLLDVDHKELPKDEQGNYIAVANERYKLTFTVKSPNGFPPGTYQHQIPNGMMINGDKGEFVLEDGTNIGSWEVTDTGLITFAFNEEANRHSKVTISSTMDIHFPEQDEPIHFDGEIYIKVEPPVQKEDPTYLEKWTNPGENTDKLIWHVNIFGRADSQIPGSILTDQILLPEWYKPHSYTQSDMDAGISFGVSDPNGGWHSWTVHTDDPHLIWNESTWSYKIPQTVICDTCGELELGNNGWEYYISYTSTPDSLNTPGTFSYANKVTVDGQTAWGWNEFTHSQVNAEIIKNGSFVSDASGGGFLWEVQARIPGRPEGQRAEYSWFIMDETRLVDESGTIIGRAQNDMHLSTVTATYNGTVIHIPRIQDATDQDMFAWDNSWTATENGVSYNRTINLLCRCQCTPETCHWSGCGDYWFQKDDGTWAANGFCQCWTETQNMTFTFVYKTEDVSLIKEYGSLGYQVNNLAQLYYMPDSDTSVRVSHEDASVTIPNLFEKKLTQDYNGYTAHYKITVNEAKAVLTNGSPLTIHDVMTDTLAYISGSLVITAEDADGNITTLQQGADYTVTYDGTGGQTDPSGKKVHVLDIVIRNPQPVMYILNYDTTLIIPQSVTGGVKYGNSASITLWGKEITDDADEKVYADINIAAKSYTVEMSKICAKTNYPLAGATFGMYNAQGGLISSGVTDAAGKLKFQTNIIEGIILREHELYYLQEIQPPPAYQLNEEKYWFCFCNEKGEACKECSKLMTDTEAVRIPYETIGMINIENEPFGVELPATGSMGLPVYILCGLSLVLAPFVYGLRLRRKYERRSRE